MAWAEHILTPPSSGAGLQQPPCSPKSGRPAELDLLPLPKGFSQGAESNHKVHALPKEGPPAATSPLLRPAQRHCLEILGGKVTPDSQQQLLVVMGLILQTAVPPGIKGSELG